MNTDISTLISQLRDYCAKKAGSVSLITFGETQPSYHLLGGFLDSFATFRLREQPYYISLRCPSALMDKLHLSKSEHYHWGTGKWKWVDVRFDTVSEAQFYELIDASYALCMRRLNQHQRDLITLEAQHLTPDDIFNKLIDRYELNHRKADIQRVITKQILMQTDFADEKDMTLGQSKIGGSPDLPINWQLPTYQGKPLAFVAQVNLDEIPAQIRNPMLPQTGILYFFSVFAWQLPDGDLHPDIDWDSYKNPNFSQVLYWRGGGELIRRPIPETLKTFKPAKVTFLEMFSFPRADDYRRDVALQDMQWTEDEFARFDELGFDFDFLIFQQIGRTPQHKLLGYADVIQNRCVDAGWRLLFQIDSDYHQLHTDMMWGDGGMIYFMIETDKLTPTYQDFTHVLSDCQFG